MLILKNIARIGTCGVISNFILFIGKLFVVLVTLMLSFFWVDDEKSKGNIDSIFMPLLLIGKCGYQLTLSHTHARIHSTFAADVYVTHIQASCPTRSPTSSSASTT